MIDGNVIEVCDVHKKYKNNFDIGNKLKEKVLHRDRSQYHEFWVLRGISFEVRKGEAVGLIGSNGCGKSTTLKLLTRIIYPDKGKLNIKGRVSSLLELGAGFHPDLSGYENIYLNAAVFGLTRKEIDQRLEEIIRFSELKNFIHNPIRTYSSGMYMKLAFSIAINVDADILLIDEILGVGDVNFQKKCFEKLKGIKEKGTTIVIVSHSMEQIERICDRSIWIDEGSIRDQGKSEEVHKKYLECMDEKRFIQIKKEEEERSREKEQEEKRRATILERTKEEKKKLKNIVKQKELNKQELNNQIEDEQLCQQTLIAQINKEKVQQQAAQREAQERRKKLEVLENEVVIRKLKSDRASYFQSEKARLEVVVQEKNFELDRLNSVIREKEAEICRIESVIKGKEKQMAHNMLEKEAEIQRLEGVIRLKEAEYELLQEKFLEIK